MKLTTMPPRMQFDLDAENAALEVFSYYRNLKKDFGSKGHFEKIYCDTFVEFMKAEGFAAVASSGTNAIFAALQSLHLPTGSEVLVSPITDPGMISPIALLGFGIKLLDNDVDSLHPTLKTVQARFSEKTKCLILNHYSGKPVSEIQEIVAWARSKNIFVIEDCSQAHGAEVDGQRVGTFGDIGCFSTMFSKSHSTGGQGGVCFTKSLERFNQLSSAINKGKAYHDPNFNEKDPNTFIFPALNLSLNEISCAIGTSTLLKVDSVNERRRNFIRHLENRMIESNIQTKLIPTTDSDAPFFSIFKFSNNLNIDKVTFAKSLINDGLTLNPHYNYLVDEWNWLKPYLVDNFRAENARIHRDSTFNLLYNENYGDQEIQFICQTLIEAEHRFGPA